MDVDVLRAKRRQEVLPGEERVQAGVHRMVTAITLLAMTALILTAIAQVMVWTR
jgi:hypothetical protein